MIGAGAATLIAGGASAASGVVSSLFGKKKAYKYNSKLQQEQAEYNRALAEQQNEYNKQNSEIEYQRNLAQWNRENAEYQRRWQQENERADELWRRQNEYNEAMWNKQNEYDSPAAQMQRFREAGLSPNLIYGQSNTAAQPQIEGSPSVSDVGVAQSPNLNYSDSAGYAMSGSSGVSDNFANPFSSAANTVLGYYQYKQKDDLNDALMELYRSGAAKNFQQVDKENANRPYWDYLFEKNAELQGLNTSTRDYVLNHILPFESRIKESQSDINFSNFNFMQDSYKSRLTALKLGNDLLGSKIAEVDSNTRLSTLKGDLQEIFNFYADERYKTENEILQIRKKVGFVNKEITSLLINDNSLNEVQRNWLLTVNGIVPSVNSTYTGITLGRAIDQARDDLFKRFGFGKYSTHSPFTIKDKGQNKVNGGSF